MKAEICSYLDENKDRFAVISDSIWNYAELGFDEHKSASLLCSVLTKEGFEVTTGLAGIDTAFVGSYGEGQPVIAILGEYDALPNLSQEKATPVKKPLHEGGNGHGCGHNLLGAGSLAAAVAVRRYLEETNHQGTIKYFGCPGEENGSGKTFMVREGCFNGVDIALTWHPADVTCVIGISTLANLSVYFRFKGKTAHAAGSPHLGRSALDAVELMNVGVNFLREHIIPEARVHYAITNPGGSAPNVVQDDAEVYYFVRAPKVVEARAVYERVCDIARGAALMTGTECEICFAQGLSDYIPNKTIGEVLNKNLIKSGSPLFTDGDRELAAKFQKTLSEETLQGVLRTTAIFQGAETAERLTGKSLSDFIAPLIHIEKALPGSTDVGDVSYIIPTAQISVACCAIGTVAHTWQNTAQAGSSIGHEGMLTAAKALALTVTDLFESPETIDAAKQELQKKTKNQYVCPIPAEVKPNIKKNIETGGEA